MTKSMNCDPIQSHYIGGVVEDLSYEFLINLEDRLLGSAGKKNISGDIDIAHSSRPDAKSSSRLYEM